MSDQRGESGRDGDDGGLDVFDSVTGAVGDTTRAIGNLIEGVIDGVRDRFGGGGDDTADAESVSADEDAGDDAEGEGGFFARAAEQVGDADADDAEAGGFLGSIGDTIEANSEVLVDTAEAPPEPAPAPPPEAAPPPPVAEAAPAPAPPPPPPPPPAPPVAEAAPAPAAPPAPEAPAAVDEADVVPAAVDAPDPAAPEAADADDGDADGNDLLGRLDGPAFDDEIDAGDEAELAGIDLPLDDLQPADVDPPAFDGLDAADDVDGLGGLDDDLDDGDDLSAEIEDDIDDALDFGGLG